jgi:hypothetical protein
VVGVNLQIPPGVQDQIERGMAAQLLDHVIEEREPRGHIDHARAIDPQRRLDRGLLGRSLAGGAAVGCPQ